MSLLLKLVVGSDEMNVIVMGVFLVVEPLATFDDMSMVGPILSNVKVNVFEAVLLFPAASM